MTLQPSPCPFCSSENAAPYAVKSCHSVLCVACGGEGPEADSEGAAIEAWNRRAALASQAQPEQPKRDSFHLTSDAVVCAATALKAAVAAIYFDDSSDYSSALWEVVRALSPEMADLLEKNPLAAYQKADSVAALPVQPSDAQMLDWVQAYIRKHNRSPEFHPDWHDLRTAIRAAMAADQGEQQ